MLDGSLRTKAHSDAIIYFRLTIRPTLCRRPGFLNARPLTNPITHHCLLLTVWETKLDRQRTDGSQALQTLLEHLQRYCTHSLVATDYELTT